MQAKDGAKLSQQELKDRGWTPGAVKKFLGEPDATATNPVFWSGARVKLWAIERVEAAEFIEWRQSTDARRKKQSAKMRAKMQEAREATIEESLSRFRRELQTALAGIKLKDLKRRAVHHWFENATLNAALRDRYEDSPIEVPDPADVDPETLFRWMANYLRHGLTNYEAILDENSGRVGRAEAYDKLKEACDEALNGYLLARGEKSPS